MARSGYYKRRRGIYEHLETCQLNLLDLALHDWLCGHAQPFMGQNVPAGVWVGSSTVIYEKTGRDPEFNPRRLRRRLERLEALNYIRKFRINKSTFAYVINKHTVYSMTGIEHLVNAKETTDWRHPKYETDQRVTGSRPADDLLLTGSRPAPMSNIRDNKDRETEEIVETSDTNDTLEVCSSAAMLLEVPPDVQTDAKTLAVPTEAKANSPVCIPTDIPALPSAASREIPRSDGRGNGAAAPQQTPTTGISPIDSLTDIRDWPESESRFGINGLRLRNCLRFCIDHRKDSYYRDNPPTVASMSREKFVRMIDEQTPPGWPPEGSQTNSKPIKTDGLLNYKLDKPNFD